MVLSHNDYASFQIIQLLNLQFKVSSMETEKIKYLSEFLVCEQQGCFQAINICHKAYFKEVHCDFVDGKKVLHRGTPFDESFPFQAFYALSKIERVIERKIVEGLKGFNTNVDVIIQTAIYSSQFFLEFFNNSVQNIGEYLYLRTIQKGVQQPLIYHLSQNFCSSLNMSQQKKMSKYYKELCKENQQWQSLNAEFNLASGINSNYLEFFINKEVGYFTAFLQKLVEQNKPFSIKQYITIRTTSNGYQNDPYYYNSQFINFLTTKYSVNPEKEEMFSALEYYLHFWEYFYVVMDVSKNLINYCEEQITFYQQYEKLAGEFGFKESFLGFRMWRFNHRVSKYQPSLRNPFFCESYIYSFIEDLIFKKLYYPEEKRSYDFKQFAKYLKDFVKFVTEKKETFNFGRYRDYYDYRKRSEKFEESLKKNKDIIYSNRYFIEYINGQFAETNKVAVKKYKKFYETKKQEEDEKTLLFKQQAQALKTQLIQQEKDRFYEILYFNYLKNVQDVSLRPSRETYAQFREEFLNQVSEEYLRQQDERYREQLQESGRIQREGEEEGKEDKKKEIVKQEINAIEEKIAEINVDDDSEQEDSDYEQELICACCKGRPYDCQAKECLVMGCCTACMLD